MRKSNFLVFSVIFTFLACISQHSVRAIQPLTGDEDAKAHADCAESVLLTATRKRHVIEPDEEVLEKPGVKCEWNLIGSPECRPQIKCSKFKLVQSAANENGEPCPEEHLEITDGSGGFERYCGAEGPKGVVPPGELRDLYIRFKGHKDPKSLKNKGFKCIVTCAQSGDKPLEANTEPEVNKICDCGNKKNQDRIVGGENADKGEFPWIVALATAGTRKPFCGGTIVADRFVVTAAHCFKGQYVHKDKLEVLGSSHALDVTDTKSESKKTTPEELEALDEKDGTVRFQIEKYFIHPLYVRQTNDFDIAVIKLNRPIDFTKVKKLQPACMPSLGSFDQTWENTQATVAGWGLNDADATNTMAILQKLNVTIFSKKECQGFFDERFNSRMMCAGFEEGGKDSCKGDSGGPLITQKTKNTFMLIGAVSWGEGCAAKKLPGVYVKISEVNQWIRYIINKEEGVWCYDRP
jgi:hypothetical protein